MKTTIASRRYAALALAHRWFGFLETEWGETLEHLEMFDPSVTLSGRDGTVVFARDRDELRAWFAAVPDPTSSHHILHSVWTDGGPDGGSLSFVVAYQAPREDLPPVGSIIRYTTTVTFHGGTARFAALDKTPVLPNTEPNYQASWAAHRAQAYLYTLLSAPDLNPSAAETLGSPGDAVIQAWAPAPAPASSYTATIIVQEQNCGPRVSRWQFEDSWDAALPTPVSITHFHQMPATDINPSPVHR
ncbi:MAG: hypothetical protein EOP31_14535 [Rhodococcus sp. (in: high G+C Gram-positive bacteria)]|uniref:hypothetical protein n=1 Tax=Rhodococcus sp. TaxID=1831 RepID=UPI001207C456|nr:hypothetical protein [Rhodococcus sp. (in: high G+C Gram-positive bacteria)]RZL24657.1 MAG: hypothetical protein EOP31_14535 [Rhodococcus sp. (in: high G+C Gram-positive bacteria)]